MGTCLHLSMHIDLGTKSQIHVQLNDGELFVWPGKPGDYPAVVDLDEDGSLACYSASGGNKEINAIVARGKWQTLTSTACRSEHSLSVWVCGCGGQNDARTSAVLGTNVGVSLLKI